MKRTTSLILIMVMLLSILGGCANNNASDISSELPEVSSSNTERVDNNSEISEVESSITESSKSEETSTVSKSETTSTVTSNTSQTTKPNKKPSTSSTTSNTTTKPSTSDSSTSNNSSSSNTNSSTVADNYVYRNPTVFVDGMYKIDSTNLPNTRQLCMGDVYVEKKYVEEQHSYYNYTLQELIEFDVSHIITDVNKMPYNYKLYAYVTDTIPNWLYEKNISLNECKDATPLQIYLITYDDTLYNRALEYITEFYFSIGCISYDSEYGPIWGNLWSSIYMPYHDPVDYNKLEQYVNYVKKNKIKLTTVAEPLLPIVYATKDFTFIRTKVTVNAESPVTNNIKMFLHDNLTLKNGENIFYIDVPLACIMEDSIIGNEERDWYWVPKIYIDKKDLSQYIIG